MNPFSAGLASAVGSAVLVILSLALALAFVRLVKGPSLPDRVVALDLMVTIAVGMMAAHALVTRETAVLDAGIVAALIGFMGTAAFANYLERRGPK